MAEEMPLSDDEPISLEPDEPISLDADDAAPAAPAAEPVPMDEPEPIELAGPPGPEARPAVRAFGAAAVETTGKTDFRRSLNLTGQGATRCRIFHSKVAISPLQFMENQINEWLDGEDIEIKAVQSFVGVMEGKKPEPNVIVIVWY